MAVSRGDGRYEPTAEAYPGLDEYWTAMGPAQGRSPWAAPYYPEPAALEPAAATAATTARPQRRAQAAIEQLLGTVRKIDQRNSAPNVRGG